MKSNRSSSFLVIGLLSLAGTQAFAQFFGEPAVRRAPHRGATELEQSFFADQEDQDQQSPLFPPQRSPESDPAKSKDPKVYCSVFQKKEVLIDGQTQYRYEVSDPKFLQCLPKQPSAPWVVKKEAWSADDEKKWQDFVKRIGQSKCNTLDTCLASEANPYRDQLDLDGTHYADCADFPMYLRAYFSYRNRLPFSVVYGIETNPLSGTQMAHLEKRRAEELAKGKLEKFEESLKDVRYSLNGNFPKSRVGVPHVNGTRRDFFNIASSIANVISSATYRMHDTAGPVEADFYSPMITRDSIKPGTVLYKVTGHVAVVYDVTEEGEVKFVDAHPDNSISRGSFSREFVLSNPFQGGGFKNWRPFKLVAKEKSAAGADLSVKKERDGSILNARFVFAKDSEIADFSSEQYYGNRPSSNWDWKTGKYVHRGQELNFFDFAERRLASPGYRAEPVKLLKRSLLSLCQDMKDRSEAVQKAIDSEIHTHEHPENLPRNIYGAEGEWESYSTPGRDLRLRKKALDVIDDVKVYMKRIEKRDPFYKFDGTLVQMKTQLINVYNEVNSSCRISYKNSLNQVVKMDLSTALNRVTRISFDPYFCPERRWGARYRSELSTCVETADKAQWYEYTQFLRNQVIRDPTEIMGYSLDDVQRINEEQARDANAQTSRFNIQRALKGL